jgi:holo-[acyl-carrier protein] synthase
VQFDRPSAHLASHHESLMTMHETTSTLYTGGLEVRVGVDLMAVADVAESVAHLGDPYLNRVFTHHERSCCDGAPDVSAARLAARFAAKEATLKVLRAPSSQPDWRSIEVRQDPGGWCHMRLAGEAARLAEEAGVTSMAVSLTHEAGMAAAVVVALCATEESR